MEQPLQTRLPLPLIMGVTSILGSYLFLSWTADDGLAEFVRIFYSQRSIKTFSAQCRIVVNTTYYFSLIVLLSYVAALIYRGLTPRKDEQDEADPIFTQTTKKALKIAFYSFIVFIACFYHLLQLDALSRRYINLLPFWFLITTIVFLVCSWLSRWARVKLFMNGVIMSVMLWVLVVGEIYHNGFIHQVINL